MAKSLHVSRRAATFALILMLLTVVSLPAFSQGSQGTIRGGVFDQTGGAIAVAKVTVTDVARGVIRNLTTDTAGQYSAPALNVGTYTVRAEATGFAALERKDVLLEVGQDVRVDLVLRPGEQTQTVTVTEEVPAIDTTSATLGGAVQQSGDCGIAPEWPQFLSPARIAPRYRHSGLEFTPPSPLFNGPKRGGR